MAEIAERVHELICPGQWFDGASEFTINRETVEEIIALVEALETKLEAYLPVISIPSCWPADTPTQEPGALTTTGGPVVWQTLEE